jgi:hypothetical protein
MADFSLNTNQNFPIAIAVGDASGNPITGDVFDAGTVLPTSSDPALTVAVDAGQTTVTCTATGAAVTGITVVVPGSVNGTALTPYTIVVDTLAVADVATQVLGTPGTAVDNA